MNKNYISAAGQSDVGESFYAPQPPGSRHIHSSVFGITNNLSLYVAGPLQGVLFVGYVSVTVLFFRYFLNVFSCTHSITWNVMFVCICINAPTFLCTSHTPIYPYIYLIYLFIYMSIHPSTCVPNHLSPTYEECWLTV